MSMNSIQLEICSNPIFIIGSPRSGTTILAWSLAQHSQLWTSGELHLLFKVFGTSALTDGFQRETALPGGWLQQEGVDRAEFLQYVGIGLNALFTSRSQGKRWIDQTPVNTLMLDVLAEMFPGALFLHILRDGRSVVNSMIHFRHSLDETVRASVAKAGFYPPWATNFKVACETWRESVELAMDFASRHPERCLTVRYEKLLADPHQAFREMFQFIGVPYEEASETYLQSNRINSSFSSTPGISPVTQGPAWNEWTPDQKLMFSEEAISTLIKYALATTDELEFFCKSVGAR